jgi:hypothetical protein
VKDFERELTEHVVRGTTVHFAPSRRGKGLVDCTMTGPGSHSTMATAAKAEEAFEIAKLRHDSRWSLAKGMGRKGTG